MALLTRQKGCFLNKRINSSTSVFQILRSLEMSHVSNNISQTKKINLQCSSSLSFPVSDIEIIETLHDQIHVQLNFMGLIGVDGCLPNYFNDSLHIESDNTERLKTFLDIFHNNLYELCYQIWKRQQIDISLELKEQHWLEFFQSFVPRLDLKYESLELAPNLLGSKKTLTGLYSLLNTSLPSHKIKIETMIAKWSRSDKPNLLGVSQIQLGDNVLLGERYLSALNGLSIEIGPMSDHEFMLLKKQKQSLLNLIKKYLDIFYDINLIVIINYNGDLISLGQKDLVLSENTYLGQQTIQIKKQF